MNVNALSGITNGNLNYTKLLNITNEQLISEIIILSKNSWKSADPKVNGIKLCIIFLRKMVTNCFYSCSTISSFKWNNRPLAISNLNALSGVVNL